MYVPLSHWSPLLDKNNIAVMAKRYLPRVEQDTLYNTEDILLD